MAGNNQYDVVVIGAGPAGATAAVALGKSGARVLLIERCRLPRPKLCAGLITAKTVAFVRGHLGTSVDALQANGVIHTSAYGYGIATMAGHRLDRRMADPFYLVDRSRYDAHWVRQAQEVGVRVRTGVTVLSVMDRDSSIRVVTDTDRISAGAVIAADGANSRVRNGLVRNGTLPAVPHHGRGLALEAVADDSVWRGASPTPTLFFGIIPGGYGWLFPGPGGGATIGVCGRNQSVQGRFRQAFQRLVRELNAPEESIGPVKSHPLPLGCYYRRPGAGRILLAGDAAGFADPVLGEGVYYAHASGYLAAQALCGDARPGPSVADDYAARLSVSLLRELKWAGHWRWLLYGPGAWGQFRMLPWLFRWRGEALEAMVHGRRSFSLGRPSYI